MDSGDRRLKKTDVVLAFMVFKFHGRREPKISKLANER